MHRHLQLPREALGGAQDGPSRQEDGWTVRWGLTWHAEAKRGEDHEEATGPMLDEALAGLAQLARLDMVGHAP